MKVLVTGACGFLGRNVVKEFLERGHTVRALDLPAINTDRLPWADQVEFFLADLRSAEGLDEAFEGIDAVVHLAAGTSGSEESQFAASVVGTEHLLDAMAKSSVRRIVFCSTFSVYDWQDIRGRLTEESPLTERPYNRDPYTIAKVWQERVVRRYAKDNDWQLTVIRPGYLWGPGLECIAGIGQSVGRLHVVIGPFRRLPIAHVQNSADCFVTATEKSEAIGETFNLVDCDDIRAWRFMGDYLRKSSTSGIRVALPYWMGLAMAYGAGVVSRCLFGRGGKLPSILVPCRYVGRFKSVRFGHKKLSELLGWTPPLSYQQALDCTHECGKSNSKENTDG